ncbi:MAG: M42 family peptidase, partial [Eubacterium sp.]|nr:M42 family peptidase [Eubacterium sp.]
MTDTKQLLKDLTSAKGVGGAEGEICELLKKKLEKLGKVSVDSMNNVYCTFGEGYHFLLDAHLDEIGMIVTSITEDGFLKVDKVGGIDNRMLLSSEVSVLTAKGEIRGVISNLPPHLQKDGDDDKIPDLNEVSIDIGLNKEEAEK